MCTDLTSMSRFCFRKVEIARLFIKGLFWTIFYASIKYISEVKTLCTKKPLYK